MCHTQSSRIEPFFSGKAVDADVAARLRRYPGSYEEIQIEGAKETANPLG